MHPEDYTMSAKCCLRITNKCTTKTLSYLCLFHLFTLLLILGCSNTPKKVIGVWKTTMKGDWSAHLYDVHFISETHGWIVGNSVGMIPGHSSFNENRDSGRTYTDGTESIILHTTDGGENWHRQNSGIYGLPLWKVFFLSQSEGWSVGEGGIIVYTTDGGENWKQIESNTQNNLNSLYFYNSYGWIVGDWGTLLKTTDGGRTYKQVESTVFGQKSIKDIYFVNQTHGWIVTYNTPDDTNNAGYVYHTTDGGETWEEQFTTESALFGVHFVDEMTGWVVGDHRSLYLTNNGGDSWEFVTDGSNRRHKTDYGQPEYLGKEPLHTFTLYDIDFVDHQNGWIVGDLGVILHTDSGNKKDGKSVWKHQRGGPRYHNSADGLLLGVDFFNKKFGWTVGENGTILHTRNGGISWEAQSNPTHLLFDVCLVGQDKAYTVGDRGAILRTENGGKDWEAQDSRTAECFGATHFVTPEKGWAVAEAGVILHTTNGGAVWQKQTSNTQQDLLAVFFIDEKTGWCVGSSGEVVHTSDGGTTWTQQQSGVQYNLFGVHFSSKQDGWIVGLFGTLLFTEDGGKSWQQSNLGQQLKNAGMNSNVWLSSVYFISTNIGWVVGENGVIFYTSNKGISWVLQESHTTNFLYDVFFISEDEGWVVGKQGLVLHTTNGGKNWRPQRTDTQTDLTAIYMSGPRSGLVTGQGGTILRYEIIQSE